MRKIIGLMEAIRSYYTAKTDDCDSVIIVMDNFSTADEWMKVILFADTTDLLLNIWPFNRRLGGVNPRRELLRVGKGLLGLHSPVARGNWSGHVR